MHMKKIIAYVFFVLCSQKAISQLPNGYTVKWQYEQEWYRGIRVRSLNSTGNFNIYKNFQLAADSSLIYAGGRLNSQTGKYDLWLTKLSLNGIVVLEKNIVQDIRVSNNQSYHIELNKEDHEIILTYRNNQTGDWLLARYDNNFSEKWAVKFDPAYINFADGTPIPSPFGQSLTGIKGIDIMASKKVVLTGLTSSVQAIGINYYGWLKVFDSSGNMVTNLPDTSFLPGNLIVFNTVKKDSSTIYRLMANVNQGGFVQTLSIPDAHVICTTPIPPASRANSYLQKSNTLAGFDLWYYANTTPGTPLTFAITDDVLVPQRLLNYNKRIDLPENIQYLQPAKNKGTLIFQNILSRSFSTGHQGSFAGALDSLGNVEWYGQFDNIYINNLIGLSDGDFIACYDVSGTDRVYIARISKNSPGLKAYRSIGLTSVNNPLIEPITSSQEELKIYPNPAHDYISFALPINMQKQEISINVIETTSGRIVKTQRLNGSSNQQIEISKLSAGSYILVVKSKTNTLRESFIKK
jgi:Secretion system C-terminal sorting domain